MTAEMPLHLRTSDACYGLSAACREMLDRAMLEAVLGRRDYGKVRKTREADARAVSSRWRGRTDLRRFAPHNGRPLSPGGAGSFHFRVERITTASVSGDAVGGSTDGKRSAAFEVYISDEAKVEHIGADIAERYLVMDKGGVELGEEQGRADLLISTIGTTLAEREQFWIERADAVAKPGTPTLILIPSNGSLDDWAALADDPTTPLLVAKTVRKFGDRFRSAAHDPASSETIVIDIIDGKTLAWADELGMRFGRSKGKRMVHFRKPRAGRIQMRFACELPVEFGAADRAAVVREFCEALARSGVAFTAVVHKPDAHNDDRNFHLHVIAAPARYPLLTSGQLDLAKGHQLRPGELAAEVDGQNRHALAEMGWRDREAEDIRALRRHFADLCNVRLEQAGSDRRLDPRSYQAMGIDQAPQEHLGSAAASLVAAGGDNEIDHANAVRSWSAFDRRRLAAIAEEKALHVITLSRIDKGRAGATDLLRRRLTAMRDDYVALSDRIVDSAGKSSEADMLEAMARSAPERLERTTGRIIEALETGGNASAADRRNEAYIRARARLADAHLAAIDEAVAPWRDDVEMLRHQLSQDRIRLAALEQEINHQLVEAEREETAALWWSETVLERAPGQMQLSPGAHCDALVQHLQQQGPRQVDEEHFVFIEFDALTQEFSILNLRDHDATLLEREAFKARLLGQLQRSAEYQALEVGRLLKAVEKHGVERVAEGRDFKGSPLPRTPARLYARYRHHPLFEASVEAAENAFSRECGRASDAKRSPQISEIASTPQDAHRQSSQDTSHAAPPAVVATDRATRNVSLPVERQRPADRAAAAVVCDATATPTIATDAPTAGEGNADRSAGDSKQAGDKAARDSASTNVTVRNAAITDSQINVPDTPVRPEPPERQQPAAIAAPAADHTEKIMTTVAPPSSRAASASRVRHETGPRDLSLAGDNRSAAKSTNTIKDEKAENSAFRQGGAAAQEQHHAGKPILPAAAVDAPSQQELAPTDAERTINAHSGEAMEQVGKSVPNPSIERRSVKSKSSASMESLRDEARTRAALSSTAAQPDPAKQSVASARDGSNNSIVRPSSSKTMADRSKQTAERNVEENNGHLHDTTARRAASKTQRAARDVAPSPLSERNRQREHLAALANIFHDQNWDPREWRARDERAAANPVLTHVKAPSRGGSR